MSKDLRTLSSLALSTVLIVLMLVLTSCEQSPGEWEREEIITDFGDNFEHFYRFVPGGFNDPRYEHRIVHNGNEVLSYTKEHEDSGIECIYNGIIIVYDVHMELIYRKSNENIFRALPIDSKKKEFYPAYYRLMLQGSNDIIEMLLSSGDKYAKEVALAYAQGDFSEAEKQGINFEPAEDKRLIDYCSRLVEKYHLSK